MNNTQAIDAAKELIKSGGYTYKSPQKYYLTFILTRLFTGSKVNPVYGGNYRLKAYDNDIKFNKEIKIEKPINNQQLIATIAAYVVKWTKKYDETAIGSYIRLRKLAGLK